MVKHDRIMDSWDCVSRDLMSRGSEGIVLTEFDEDCLWSIVWEFFLEKEAMERNLIAWRELTKRVESKVTLSTVNLEFILAIRRWLGGPFALWIVAHPFRDKDMVARSRNGARDSPENPFGAFRHEVEEMISWIGGKMISKAKSHFSLMVGQLEDLREEMEIFQAASKVIMTKIENLDCKVENSK